ncbi:MAG: SDR family NAD(P)-dependent oxidoreductase, partial [Candidatus Natronoplasma sp.]
MGNRLEGKKALVTGASRGIGRAIAEKFSEEKAIVGINYNSSDEKAQHVLKCVERNSEGMLLKGDVSQKEECRQIISNFVKEHRGIDILINNAGIYKRKNIEEATIEEFDETMGVNVRGPFMLCKFSLAHLKKSDSGRIINMSSQLAFSGSDHGTS